MTRFFAVTTSIALFYICNGVRADPICVPPDSKDPARIAHAQRLEQIVSDTEVERAWEALVRTPARTDKSAKSESPLGMTAEYGELLYGGFLLERAYRMRAELELAEAGAKGESADENVSKRRAAFEHAQEKFCVFLEHGFIPEFRPNFDKP